MKSYYYGSQQEKEDSTLEDILYPVQQAAYFLGIPASVVALKKALQKKNTEIQDRYKLKEPKQKVPSVKGFDNPFFEEDFLGTPPQNINEVIKAYNENIHERDMASLEAMYKNEKNSKLETMSFDTIEDKEFIKEVAGVDATESPEEAWDAIENKSPEARRKMKELIAENEVKKTFGVQMQLHQQGYQEGLNYETQKSIAVVDINNKLVKDAVRIIQKQEGLAVKEIAKRDVNGNWLLSVTDKDGKNHTITVPKSDNSNPYKVFNSKKDWKGVTFQSNRAAKNSIVVMNGQKMYLQGGIVSTGGKTYAVTGAMAWLEQLELAIKKSGDVDFGRVVKDTNLAHQHLLKPVGNDPNDVNFSAKIMNNKSVLNLAGDGTETRTHYNIETDTITSFSQDIEGQNSQSILEEIMLNDKGQLQDAGVLQDFIESNKEKLKKHIWNIDKLTEREQRLALLKYIDKEDVQEALNDFQKKSKRKISFNIEEVFDGFGGHNAQAIAENVNIKGANYLNTVNKNLTEPTGMANRSIQLWEKGDISKFKYEPWELGEKTSAVSTAIEATDKHFKFKKVRGIIKRRFQLSADTDGDEALRALQRNDLDIQKSIDELKSVNPNNSNLKKMERLGRRAKSIKNEVKRLSKKTVEIDLYKSKVNAYAEDIFKKIQKEHMSYINRTNGFNHSGDSLIDFIEKQKEQLLSHMDENKTKDVYEVFSPREQNLLIDNLNHTVDAKDVKKLNAYYSRLVRKLTKIQKDIKQATYEKNKFLVNAERKGNELILNFGDETFHKRKKVNSQFNTLDKKDDHIRNSTSAFTVIVNKETATQLGAVEGAAVYLNKGDSNLEKSYRTKRVGFSFYQNNGTTYMLFDEKSQSGNEKIEIKQKEQAEEMIKQLEVLDQEIKERASNRGIKNEQTVVEINGRRFLVPATKNGILKKENEDGRKAYLLDEIIEENKAQATSKMEGGMAKSTIKIVNVENIKNIGMPIGLIRNNVLVGNVAEHLKGGERGKGQRFMFDSFNLQLHNNLLYLSQVIKNKKTGNLYSSLKHFMHHEKQLARNVLSNTLFTFQNIGNNELLEMHKEFTSDRKRFKEKYKGTEKYSKFREALKISTRLGSTIKPVVKIDRNGEHVVSFDFDVVKFKRITRNQHAIIYSASDMMKKIPQIEFAPGKKIGLTDNADNNPLAVDARRKAMNAAEDAQSTYLTNLIRKNGNPNQKNILIKMLTEYEEYSDADKTHKNAIKVGEDNAHIFSHIMVMKRDAKQETFWASQGLSTMHLAKFDNPSFDGLKSQIKVDSLFLFKLKAKNPAFYALIQHGNEQVNQRLLGELEFQDKFLDFRNKLRENLKDFKSEVGKVSVDNWKRLHIFQFKKGFYKNKTLTKPFVYDAEELDKLASTKKATEYVEIEQMIQNTIKNKHPHDSSEFHQLISKLKNGKAMFGTMIGEADLNELEEGLKSIEGMVHKGGVIEGNVNLPKLLQMDTSISKLEDIVVPMRFDFNEIRQSIMKTVNGQKYHEIDPMSSHGMSFNLLSHVHALKLISDKKNEIGTEKAKVMSDAILKGITTSIENYGKELDYNAGKSGSIIDKMYKRKISGTFNMFNSVNINNIEEVSKNVFQGRGSLGQVSMTAETFLDVTLGTERHEYARKIGDNNEIRKVLKEMIEHTTGNMLDPDKMDDILHEMNPFKFVERHNALAKKIRDYRKAGNEIEAVKLEKLTEKIGKFNPDQIDDLISVYNDKGNVDTVKMYRNGLQRINEIQKGAIELVESFRHPLHTFGDFVSERVNIVKDAHLKRGQILGSWVDQLRRFGDEDKDLTYWLNRGAATFLQFNVNQQMEKWYEAQNIFKNTKNYILSASVHVGQNADGIGFMRAYNYQAEKMILKHGDGEHKFILQDTKERINAEIEVIAKRYNLSREQKGVLINESRKSLSGKDSKVYYIKDNLQFSSGSDINQIEPDETLLSFHGKKKTWAHTLTENNIMYGTMQEKYDYMSDETKEKTKKYKDLSEKYKKESDRIFNGINVEDANMMKSYFNQISDEMKKQKTNAGAAYKEVTLSNMRMQTLKSNGNQAIAAMRDIASKIVLPAGFEKAREGFLKITEGLIDPNNRDITKQNLASFVESVLDNTTKPMAEELSLQIKHGGHDVVSSTIQAFSKLKTGLDGGKWTGNGEIRFSNDVLKVMDEISSGGLEVKSGGRHEGMFNNTDQNGHQKFLGRERRSIKKVIGEIIDPTGKANIKKLMAMEPKDLIEMIDQRASGKNINAILDKIANPQNHSKNYSQNKMIVESIGNHIEKSGASVGTTLLGLLSDNLHQASGNYRMLGKSSASALFTRETAFQYAIINSYIENKDPLRKEAANMVYEMHQAQRTGYHDFQKRIENRSGSDKRNLMSYYKEIMDIDPSNREINHKESQQRYQPERGAIHASKNYFRQIENLKMVGKSAVVGTFLAAGINQIMGGYSLPDLKDTAGVGGETYEKYKTKESEHLIKPPPPRIEPLNPNYREDKRLESGYREINNSHRKIGIKNYTVDNNFQQDNLGVKIR